jgi:dihydrofolate synthase/folylpolyglutamate synthase
MFHRIGAAAYRSDLGNILALTEILNHPEKKINTIHVAGTNGKGSVSNMLSSVFQEAGYRTGLFTSPHLKDFRERIRINGEMISEPVVIDFVLRYKKQFEEIKPSFFEWTTALAFYHFANENTDVCIIETGLGGRLDSTNIISPELSVITNISFDHMNLLGDSIEKIAVEKAGIIKSGIPVVIGERQQGTDQVFSNAASDKKSEVCFAEDNFHCELIKETNEGQVFCIKKNNVKVYSELITGLKGNYQDKNICTVMQALEILKKKFEKINNEVIKKGIKNIEKNTGLQGRWQIIGQGPLTIADVAHNEAGLKYVLAQLSRQAFDNLHIVFGVVNDKNVRKILSLLPKAANYYFCKADIPRALDAESLRNQAIEFELKGDAFRSVKDAFSQAKKNAGRNDLIFIGGSNFVVAEIV